MLYGIRGQSRECPFFLYHAILFQAISPNYPSSYPGGASTTEWLFRAAPAGCRTFSVDFAKKFTVSNADTQDCTDGDK